MRLFAHWFFMLRATVWLLLAFARAMLYFRTKAVSDLQLPRSKPLTSKERRRLQHYFYGGTYLSILFCTIRGRLRSKAEKHRLTNLAALAYFFDDLVDSFRTRDDTGILWRDNPEEYGLAADDHRRLALHFLHNIYQELPPAHLGPFKTAMNMVFNVETAGRQQYLDQVRPEEIFQVTKEKGGHSVLLFRMIHEPLPDEAERAALFQFGCLIQYCDDIFDAWFDFQEKTHTVATELLENGQVGALRRVFVEQVESTRAAFHAMNAPFWRIETALGTVHFITSITLVCLDHYAVLAKEKTQIPIHDRKAMVVDMEKWPNRFRAAWYLASNSFTPWY